MPHVADDVAERVGPMVNLNAGGRWNTFEITAQGTKLIVVINGMQSVEVDERLAIRIPA